MRSFTSARRARPTELSSRLPSPAKWPLCNPTVLLHQTAIRVGSSPPSNNAAQANDAAPCNERTSSAKTPLSAGRPAAHAAANSGKSRTFRSAVPRRDSGRDCCGCQRSRCCRREKVSPIERGHGLCFGGCPTPPGLKGLIPVQTGYNAMVTGTAFSNAVLGKNQNRAIR
jgi:hypothetical protein